MARREVPIWRGRVITLQIAKEARKGNPPRLYARFRKGQTQ